MGGFSALLERRYPGIAIQAVGLTFGVLAVLLVAYSMRLIRATQQFRSIVIGATGAIALLYLVRLTALSPSCSRLSRSGRLRLA